MKCLVKITNMNLCYIIDRMILLLFCLSSAELFYFSFTFHRTTRLQNSQFFLKIGKEIGKAWRMSLTGAKLMSLTRP